MIAARPNPAHEKQRQGLALRRQKEACVTCERPPYWFPISRPSHKNRGSLAKATMSKCLHPSKPVTCTAAAMSVKYQQKAVPQQPAAYAIVGHNINGDS